MKKICGIFINFGVKLKGYFFWFLGFCVIMFFVKFFLIFDIGINCFFFFVFKVMERILYIRCCVRCRGW